MGLDSLDLMFRLEKRLGITIGRDEGYVVLFGTVGALHRYLVTKLRREHQEIPRIEPMCQRLVVEVRRLAGRWRVNCSSDVRKRYSLNTRFSPESRLKNWNALGEALGVSLPPLQYPEGEAFPRIPKQCDSILSLAYWIAEHHPGCVEWFPAKCEQRANTAPH